MAVAKNITHLGLEPGQCIRRHGRARRSRLRRLASIRPLEGVHGTALPGGVRLAARREADDVVTCPHPIAHQYCGMNRRMVPDP